MNDDLPKPEPTNKSTASLSANPKPAPQQIWRSPCGKGEHTLGAEFREFGCTMHRVPHGSVNMSLLADGYGWRCVGIETPHGRVMVGERRNANAINGYDANSAYALIREVLFVVDGERVWLSDGVEGWAAEAAKIATWPLVHDEPAKPKVADLLAELLHADDCWYAHSPVAREARRREIDAVLREDARAHPAFATARRCAVMAAVEAWERVKDGREFSMVNVTCLVADLRRYEDARGGLTKPNTDAGRGISYEVLAAYESARSLP
ncbi:MAG TPA: hypothetical protein VLT47_10830 [Anaeromyxobacteraceae bacterium]|nr:hypothetical protein [Anaeromyxobacteraceae bacterium]